jgi:hypothetical protein
LILLLAAVAHFVAWIGAVLNTVQLPDKTWFVVCLLSACWALLSSLRRPMSSQGQTGSKPKRS